MKQIILIMIGLLILSENARTGISSYKKSSFGYPYMLSMPKGSTKKDLLPLIVFLHGKSLSGDSLEKLHQYGAIAAIKKGKKIPAIVLAPQCPEGEGWNPAKIYRLIQRIKKTYTVDTNRIYVTGMSMGGYGTFRFVAKYPDLIAAAAPLCGGGEINTGQSLSKVPLWVMHGARDTEVPIIQSKKMVKAIYLCDSTKCLFTVFPKLGHGELTQCYEMDELYTWLLSHKKENGISRFIPPSALITENKFYKIKKKAVPQKLEQPTEHSKN